jgi:hypothetical protein
LRVGKQPLSPTQLYSPAPSSELDATPFTFVGISRHVSTQEKLCFGIYIIRNNVVYVTIKFIRKERSHWHRVGFSIIA